MQRKLRITLIVGLTILSAYSIMVTVAELPPYGMAHNATYNEVTHRYMQGSLEDTGVPNMITAIVLDYRAYDTMFETIVLFTAVIAVLITLKGSERQGGQK